MFDISPFAGHRMHHHHFEMHNIFIPLCSVHSLALALNAFQPVRPPAITIGTPASLQAIEPLKPPHKSNQMVVHPLAHTYEYSLTHTHTHKQKQSHAKWLSANTNVPTSLGTIFGTEGNFRCKYLHSDGFPTAVIYASGGTDAGELNAVDWWRVLMVSRCPTFCGMG